jgi:hypothetical protein
MMVSPLSAGLAGSNSMAAYPNIMFRADFAKCSFVFRIRFLWLTSSAINGAEIGTRRCLLARPGSQEHGFLSLNEMQISYIRKKRHQSRNKTATMRSFERHDPDTDRQQS